MAPNLSPWLPGLQARSEALLLPRLGSVVAVPQLLGPVWAHRRNDDRRDGGERTAPEVLQSASTAATTAATAAAAAAAATAAAAAAAARQPDAPPSPVAELPSLPLDGYLRQRSFHRIATVQCLLAYIDHICTYIYLGIRSGSVQNPRVARPPPVRGLPYILLRG